MLWQSGVFARLDGALDRERRTGMVPAVALAVWRDGDIVYTNCFGRLVPDDPKSGPVSSISQFDLASLAKPLAGVPLGLGMIQEQAAGADLVPAILEHSTGCIDADLMPQLVQQRSGAALADALRISVSKAGSDDYRYSNAAYAAIGAWCGRDVGAATTWLRRHYWIDAGSVALTYRPDVERCVASGLRADGTWVRGTPFDPLADLMVRGLAIPPTHSGLFGTAEDVARFGGYLTKEPEPLALLVEAPRKRTDTATDSDVWVTPGGLRSATDLPLAPPGARPGRVLYQTGYTGCLLWIDMEERCAVALLSNATAVDAQADFDALSNRVVGIILQGYQR